MEEARVDVGGAVVTASVHGAGETAVVLGHGAGGDRRNAFLVRCAEVLAASGRRAVLYNFPYAEARRRIPDPAPLLEATVAAVAAFARGDLAARRLVVGGRSMGGRIGSQAVAKGLPVDALLFFAYPLHPPGKPETLRDKHLFEAAVPLLFVQGTRDAFARWDLLTGLVERLGERARLLPIEGGDHSFKVPKRSGKSPSEIERLALEGVTAWLDSRSL